MWERLKMDFKERFFNFETAKGVYLVPAGAATMYVSVFHQQYIFTAVGLIFGWYCVSEGLRKIQVNRFAQARAAQKIAEEREKLEGGGAAKAGVFESE